MDIIKFEVFIKVVSSGSFSSAANDLGYTPSGVMRMINSLEAEYGATLLKRASTGIQLTYAGQQLLPIFKSIVRLEKQSKEIIGELNGLYMGELSVGAVISTASNVLPRILKRYYEQNPGIKVYLAEGVRADLKKRLMEQTIDLCFLTKPVKDMEWIPLFKESWVAWVPEKHPKSRLTEFRDEDFRDEPFIYTYPNMKSDLSEMIEQSGLQLDVAYSTLSNFTTYSTVDAGLGISISAGSMADKWNGNVRCIPLASTAPYTVGIVIPSLKTCSSAARRFIEVVRKQTTNSLAKSF